MGGIVIGLYTWWDSNRTIHMGGIVIGLNIKGSDSNSGRKVRLTVKENLHVGFVDRG